MLAWFHRQRLRTLLPRLLDHNQRDEESAALWRRLEADPALKREATRLVNALGCFRDWPEQAPPVGYAAALRGALDTEADPLRSRLSDYHDGTLPVGEYELVRRALNAAPQVDAEYRLMAAAVSTLKSLPEAPPPADFRARLERELDRLDARRAARRRAPRGAVVLRLAAAAAVLAALVGIGWRAGRSAPGGETVGYVARQPAGPTDDRPVLEAVTAAAPQPAATPPAESPTAVEPAPPARTAAAPEPQPEPTTRPSPGRVSPVRPVRTVHAAAHARPRPVAPPVARRPVPEVKPGAKAPVTTPKPVAPKTVGVMPAAVAPGRLSPAALVRRAREEAAALAAVEKRWQTSTNALVPETGPRQTMLVVLAPREPAGATSARPQIPDPSQLNTPTSSVSSSILFERPQEQPELPLPLDFE